MGITQALLQHGYRVVANSRNISKSKDFDRIDLLVNAAGAYIPKPFTDYTREDFELMIRRNVAGYFFITQRVVAQMRKQKSGHIVAISTVLVDQPLAGAHITLPVVTKSGVSPRIGDGIRG